MTTLTTLTIARHELLLGGQKSGKSARAETLAAAWLAQSPGHRAVFIATAQAHDDEMRARIARHRADRATRLPGVPTVEAPHALAEAMAAASTPQTLVVVDCLTLWLTQQLMPLESPENMPNRPLAPTSTAQTAIISGAIAAARGPLVLVSNEIGLGVIPMGREVRAFVDALGALNQAAAAACDRVTLMAAGCALVMKGAA